MTTVLIALGAGVGGILIGAGWVIWRVSRRLTMQAGPAKPVKIPQSATLMYLAPSTEGVPVMIPTSKWMPTDGLDLELGRVGRATVRGRTYPRAQTAAGLSASDASADYAPRHEADPLAWFRPIQDVMRRHNLDGKPVQISYHEERYPARHADGYDAPSDVDPPDLREDRGW